MKKEQFFSLIGELDDRFLERYRQMDLYLSQRAYRKKRTLRVLAVAACLCLLIGACVPVGMMIAQFGKGPSVPLPSITLQSLAELETMREMIACEDEQVLNDYLHSITGGGAQSRQDLIDFVGLVDNTPYAKFMDGEITGLTYNQTDKRFSVSTEAENGESMYVSYELGMSDVEKNMKKAAEKLGGKNLLSAPLSTEDGRLTLYTETREPRSNGGDVIRWQGVLDGIAVYIVYWVADADTVDTAALLESLEIMESIVPQFPKYAWANTKFGAFVESPAYEKYCVVYDSYSAPAVMWVNQEGYQDASAPDTYRITDLTLGDVGVLAYECTWPQTLDFQSAHIYEFSEDGASYTAYVDTETGALIGWEVGGKAQTLIATSEQKMMDIAYAYLASHVSDPEAYTVQVLEEERGYTVCRYFRCVGDMQTCDAVTAYFDSEGALVGIVGGYLGAFRNLDGLPNTLVDTVWEDLTELGQQYAVAAEIKIKGLHIAPDGRVALDCSVVVPGVEYRYLAYLTDPVPEYGESDGEQDAGTLTDGIEPPTAEPDTTGSDSGNIPESGSRIWDSRHPDDSERYPYFSVSLAEFDNAVVERREGGEIYADGERLIGGSGYNCSSFYLSDVTGDGYSELCFGMGLGSGMTDMRIVIIDFTTKETIFTMENRGYNDYYLFLRNGVLCVKETKYREYDAVRTGVLTYDGSKISIAWDSEVNATIDRDQTPAPGEPIN